MATKKETMQRLERLLYEYCIDYEKKILGVIHLPTAPKFMWLRVKGNGRVQVTGINDISFLDYTPEEAVEILHEKFGAGLKSEKKEQPEEDAPTRFYTVEGFVRVMNPQRKKMFEELLEYAQSEKRM